MKMVANRLVKGMKKKTWDTLYQIIYKNFVNLFNYAHKDSFHQICC